MKQAAEDIAKGRINAALVGVTNIIWHPDMAKHWIGLEKLSADGMCRSFDENGKFDNFDMSRLSIVLFRGFETFVSTNDDKQLDKIRNECIKDELWSSGNGGENEGK